MSNHFFKSKSLLFILSPLAALCLNLSGCALETVHRNELSISTPASAPAPAPAITSPAHHTDRHSAAHNQVLPGISPEKSLGWLKNGNQRFRNGTLRKDGQSKSDLQRLSSGQSPHAIVLSCSDSRVPPELIFDQKLGEIFTIRVAGQAVDNSTLASIEYAVEHLGSQLLVVMGHTSCGAVKAAHATLDKSHAGSPALNALVQDIHPRIASFQGKSASPQYREESQANARGVAQDLLARSSLLHEKVQSGALVIKTALYHLADGNVAFDP